MEFEILNIIKFTVFTLISTMIYYKLKIHNLIKTSWKVFIILVFTLALFTYKQFFTLTEKGDNIQLQKNLINTSTSSKVLDEYLENNKPLEDKVTQEDTSKLLQQQQAKSKELANTIENKGE